MFAERVAENSASQRQNRSSNAASCAFPSAGAVGMWESRSSEFSKKLWKVAGILLLDFRAFHRFVISTVLLVSTRVLACQHRASLVLNHVHAPTPFMPEACSLACCDTLCTTGAPGTVGAGRGARRGTGSGAFATGRSAISCRATRSPRYRISIRPSSHSQTVTFDLAGAYCRRVHST